MTARLGGVLAASASDVPLAFVGLGAVLVVLATLAALADRWALTAIPFYLVAGLAIGDGGLISFPVDTEAVEIAAEIGVLLLLLALGLEFSPDELARGMRSSAPPGIVDALAGFVPGFAMGVVLGWEVQAAVLLGGVCWISSSGVVSKVLRDLGRLGNRETASVLNLLVFEDLAMAVYLPLAAALVAGQALGATLTTIVVALVAVAAVFVASMRWGELLSDRLNRISDEPLLLAVLGLTLLVAGVAHRIGVSAAIGAFLVGLAVSDPVRHRAVQLLSPLQDVFAATFFVFFAYQIDPGDLPGVLVAALVLLVVTGLTKVAAGAYAARRSGIAVPGQLRAGTVLVARGEFSIVIAALGATLADGPELGAMAAAYVLLTAVVGPVLTKQSDALATWWLDRRDPEVSAPAP